MKIVFVCTGNTCRSPMAEAFLKDILVKKGENIEDYYITSAGISTMDRLDASTNSILALKEHYIDITNHKSKRLTYKLIEDADLILTMGLGHKEAILRAFPKLKNKVFTIKEFLRENDSDVVDPYGGSLGIYRNTANEIKYLIEKVFEKILEKKEG